MNQKVYLSAVFGMKINCLVTIFCFLFYLQAFSQNALIAEDTSRVKELNELGYAIRLTDAEQTISYAKKALTLAKKLKYDNGIGEAHRVLGIGHYYLAQNPKAIANYLISLSQFTKIGNVEGQAKVYNNIGNVYRDIDYDKGLEYYKRSLELATKLNIEELIAGCYNNIGNIYYRKKNFHIALKNYEKSYEIFTKLNNPIGLTQCLQNQGVIYYRFNNISKAEELLLEANKKAKENELNNSVASINLTLTSVYIAKNDFPKAEELLNEGIAYAKIVKDEKIEHDYLYTSYELENKRKNFELALHYLKQVYKQDSINNNNNESLRFGLLQEQYRQREKEREQELIIAKQKYSQILFGASIVVSVLLLVVVGLLIWSNRRKIQTNKQLTVLNSEISQQKEELDWINHRLEEIIVERTKDLKLQNEKLSTYSWHLSHQIRSPIATMKGLMLLEKDQLIESDEFIKEMGNCLEDIDSKILTINESLADPKQSGFTTESNI